MPIVTCNAIIEFRNLLLRLDEENEKDKDGKEISREDIREWHPMQLGWDQLLCPEYNSNVYQPIPSIELKYKSVMSDVLSCVDIPFCIDSLFKSIIDSQKSEDILYDVVWLMLGTLFLHSQRVQPFVMGRECKKPSDDLINKIKDAFPSNNTTLDLYRLKELAMKLGIPLRRNLFEQVYMGFTSKADRQVGHEKSKQGIQQSHLIELLNMRSMIQYVGEDESKLSNRISSGVGRILFKLPLRIQDLLMEPFLETFSLATYRILAKMITRNPTCDFFDDKVRIFIRHSVRYWLCGIPSSSVQCSKHWCIISSQNVEKRISSILGVKEKSYKQTGDIIPLPDKGILRTPVPAPKTPKPPTAGYSLRLKSKQNRRYQKFKSNNNQQQDGGSGQQLVETVVYKSLLDGPVAGPIPKSTPDLQLLQKELINVRQGSTLAGTANQTTKATASEMNAVPTPIIPCIPSRLEKCQFGISSHSQQFTQYLKWKNVSAPPPPPSSRKANYGVSWTVLLNNSAATSKRKRARIKLLLGVYQTKNTIQVERRDQAYQELLKDLEDIELSRKRELKQLRKNEKSQSKLLDQEYDAVLTLLSEAECSAKCGEVHSAIKKTETAMKRIEPILSSVTMSMRETLFDKLLKFIPKYKSIERQLEFQNVLKKLQLDEDNNSDSDEMDSAAGQSKVSSLTDNMDSQRLLQLLSDGTHLDSVGNNISTSPTSEVTVSRLHRKRDGSKVRRSLVAEQVKEKTPEPPQRKGVCFSSVVEFNNSTSSEDGDDDDCFEFDFFHPNALSRGKTITRNSVIINNESGFFDLKLSEEVTK